MNEEPNRLRRAEDRLEEPHPPETTGRTPGGLTWPIRRFYWFVEKHFLWKIYDSFKRFTGSMRYRSPLAYIGTTLLVAMTGAAIAAAVYFHDEAKDGAATPLTADLPTATETVVAPTTPVPVTPATPAAKAKPDDTLKGVVPDFDRTAGESSGSAGSSGKQSAKKSRKSKESNPAATVVKPAKTPDSPPLKVAHNFAQTFVDYEVGKKGSARDFKKTATPRLSRELKRNPPRQPSNGKIPEASVMNVVKGKKAGKAMAVSVSLLRSGATSELRLGLRHLKGKKWLVSKVRG